MIKLGKLGTNGMTWVRSRAAGIKKKYKPLDRADRNQKHSVAWWKKDVGELLADLSRIRLAVNPGATLQTITDVSQWTTRFRAAILGLIYALGVLVATLIISSDRLSDVQAQNGEREALKTRYLRYAEQLDLLPVYRAQTETILERFGALLDAVPASLESVHVLSQLNIAAKDSGLQLELFKPLAEEIHPYYAVLPVEIRLRGGYNEIAGFLEQISKMQHLVTVDVVMLASAKHEGQIVLASLVKAYRYKDLPPSADNKASRVAR